MGKIAFASSARTPCGYGIARAHVLQLSFRGNIDYLFVRVISPCCAVLASLNQHLFGEVNSLLRFGDFDSLLPPQDPDRLTRRKLLAPRCKTLPQSRICFLQPKPSLLNIRKEKKKATGAMPGGEMDY